MVLCFVGLLLQYKRPGDKTNFTSGLWSIQLCNEIMSIMFVCVWVHKHASTSLS